MVKPTGLTIKISKVIHILSLHHATVSVCDVTDQTSSCRKRINSTICQTNVTKRGNIFIMRFTFCYPFSGYRGKCNQIEIIFQKCVILKVHVLPFWFTQAGVHVTFPRRYERCRKCNKIDIIFQPCVTLY